MARKKETRIVRYKKSSLMVLGESIPFAVGGVYNGILYQATHYNKTTIRLSALFPDGRILCHDVVVSEDVLRRRGILDIFSVLVSFYLSD